MFIFAQYDFIRLRMTDEVILSIAKNLLESKQSLKSRDSSPKAQNDMESRFYLIAFIF